jgi:cysteine synthase
MSSENGEDPRRVEMTDEVGHEAHVVERIDELVGNTPLMRIRELGDSEGAPIYVKMENLNPGGSIRDRYIAEILERAVAAGMLVQGDTVALAGLDDSAVSAAMIAGVLGVKVKIFAPEGSLQRLTPLIEKYGAQIEMTPAEDGLAGAVKQAAAWSRKGADRMYVDGYRRQAVRDAYSGIAAEILQALKGDRLGAFITSVSTGGTFRHVARELRETRPTLRVGGAILGRLELPDFKEHRFNELERFSVEEAFQWRDRIATEEGLLLGPKGAACVGLAVQLQGGLDSDQAIVALNPDSGQRYLGWEDNIEFRGSSTPS